MSKKGSMAKYAEKKYIGQNTSDKIYYDKIYLREHTQTNISGKNILTKNIPGQNILRQNIRTNDQASRKGLLEGNERKPFKLRKSKNIYKYDEIQWKPTPNLCSYYVFNTVIEGDKIICS